MTQPNPNPNPILPDNPDLVPIHTRNYEVRAFKVNDGEILLWGAVRDWVGSLFPQEFTSMLPKRAKLGWVEPN